MILEESKARQFLTALHGFLLINRKARSEKTISTELEIPLEFVQKFLSTLEATDYFKVTKSPSGRFKSARFNPYSKNIFYRDYHYGLKRGQLTVGDNRNIFYKLRELEKKALDDFEDEARNSGAFYVHCELKLETFISIFIKEMGLEFVQLQSNQRPEDEFKEFPLVKAEFDKFSALVAKLEAEIQQEIELNDKNKQWFEKEHRQAQLGLRRKNEPYSVLVGQERTVTVSHEKYWFDDDPVKVYKEQLSPKYETRYRSVVDWPSKPIEQFTIQEKNRPLIDSYKDYLNQLKNYKIVNEKKLRALKEKAEQIALLEAQKREIDQKLKRLK